MTDQTTPTPDYLLGVTLGDALRDIANHGNVLRGWDLKELAARADELAKAAETAATNDLEQVAAAARAVVDGQGTPGAMARTTALRDAITNACDDTALAVTVHAAVWLDRYGSQGAPDRMRDLAAALAAGDENRD